MPTPVLQAMVLADRVYRDAATNKYLIIGTFGKLRRRKVQPLVLPEASREPGSDIVGEAVVMSGDDFVDSGTPCLYLALRGIRSPTDLWLRFVRLDDDTVSMEAKIHVSSNDPVALVELAVNLPRLQGRAGEYSLDLLHEGVPLGSWGVSLQDEGADA